MLSYEARIVLVSIHRPDSTVHSVEGIAFSLETAVIMAGNFVKEEEVELEKVNAWGLWFKPWFYHHVESFLHLDKKKEDGGSRSFVEYVPTLDFHQRHNKPCFWLAHLWAPWASNPIAR